MSETLYAPSTGEVLSRVTDYHSPRSAFAVKRIDALLADTSVRAQTDWIVQSMFARGSLNALYGNGKIGKSTFLMHLCAAVARGEPFAGLPTKQGRALWVDLEQGAHRVKQSLLRVPGIITLEGSEFYTASDLSAGSRAMSMLTETIQAGDYALVVVDSLSKLLNLQDENSNSEVQAALAPLEACARNSSAAVVLVGHDRKSEGEHGRSLRGAGALLAGLDCAVHVQRITGKENARKYVNLTRDPDGFGVMELTLTEQGFVPLTQTDDLIQMVLKGGPMSMVELQRRLRERGDGSAPSTIKLKLDLMAVKGVVHSSGSGVKGDPRIWGVTNG